MQKTETRERVAVRAAYPGERWSKRVNNMSDSQITAVYLRLKSQGKVQ